MSLLIIISFTHGSWERYHIRPVLSYSIHNTSIEPQTEKNGNVYEEKTKTSNLVAKLTKINIILWLHDYIEKMLRLDNSLKKRIKGRSSGQPPQWALDRMEFTHRQVSKWYLAGPSTGSASHFHSRLCLQPTTNSLSHFKIFVYSVSVRSNSTSSKYVEYNLLQPSSSDFPTVISNYNNYWVR